MRRSVLVASTPHTPGVQRNKNPASAAAVDRYLRAQRSGTKATWSPPLAGHSHSMFPVRPEEPDNGKQEERSDQGVELVEILAQIIPVLARLHSQIGKPQTPGDRSDERVDVKAQPRHAGDPGRQRNEGSNHG